MKGQRFTLGQIRQAVLKTMGSVTDGNILNCMYVYVLLVTLSATARSRWECQYQRDRRRSERAGN